GYAQADGAPLRMLQPFRQFAGRFENEYITAGRGRLQQAKLPVVDPRIRGQLGKIAADQREMMTCVDAADGADALHRALVTDVAAERITGVGRIHDNAAAADDFRRAPDQAWLRIVRMDGKKLRHGE